MKVESPIKHRAPEEVLPVGYNMNNNITIRENDYTFMQDSYGGREGF